MPCATAWTSASERQCKTWSKPLAKGWASAVRFSSFKTNCWIRDSTILTLSKQSHLESQHWVQKNVTNHFICRSALLVEAITWIYQRYLWKKSCFANNSDQSALPAMTRSTMAQAGATSYYRILPIEEDLPFLSSSFIIICVEAVTLSVAHIEGYAGVMIGIQCDRSSRYN